MPDVFYCGTLATELWKTGEAGARINIGYKSKESLHLQVGLRVKSRFNHRVVKETTALFHRTPFSQMLEGDLVQTETINPYRAIIRSLCLRFYLGVGATVTADKDNKLVFKTAIMDDVMSLIQCTGQWTCMTSSDINHLLFYMAQGDLCIDVGEDCHLRLKRQRLSETAILTTVDYIMAILGDSVDTVSASFGHLDLPLRMDHALCQSKSAMGFGKGTEDNPEINDSPIHVRV